MKLFQWYHRSESSLLVSVSLCFLVLLLNSSSNSLGNDASVVDAFSAETPRHRTGPRIARNEVTNEQLPMVGATRRDSLVQLSFLATMLLSNTDPCFAMSEGDDADIGDGLRLAKPMGVDNSRPSAPLEYLLPAARVGTYIYQTLAIVEEVTKLQQEAVPLEGVSTGATTTTVDEKNSDQRTKDTIVARAQDEVNKLDALFLTPPPFIKNDDPSVSRGDQYGKNSLPIVGEIGVAAQKQKERRDRAIEVGFVPQFFEVGELVGERRQWTQLQRAERAREGASEVRRAFNIYTTNLNFSRTNYQWVGSTQDKSQRIRNDRLPTTTDVIRSDLDARDLYRNQVQTALEDARAEWMYQRKESGGNNRVDFRRLDTTELLEILTQAQVSVDKWFGFVPDRDVKLALEAVIQEQTEARSTAKVI